MRKMLCFLLSLPLILFAMPAEVIIIRHGEKDRVNESPYLDQQGLQRAGALAAFFQNDPRMLEYGLPVAIYAAQPGAQDPSQREIQTVTPLAKQLKMKVLTPYSSADVKQLAQLILQEPEYEGRMVLVCWEHKMIRHLAAAFGVPSLPKYPGDRFDLIYKIQFTNEGAPIFCLGLQELMFDDSSTPPDGFSLCN